MSRFIDWFHEGKGGWWQWMLAIRGVVVRIRILPFTLKHQYASSPHCSQYISYGAHKDNMSNNQERLLQQIQGQRFTCRLGFSPRARTYIFKFSCEKEQNVIQFVVLLSFLCDISFTPFIQTVRNCCERTAFE